MKQDATIRSMTAAKPRPLEWLNYHHLLYFWLVVREGGVAQAAKKLRLSHPTVSAQVHALEESLGEVLLVKQGRKLVLTEMGKLVHGYAEEIFTLGQELLDTVKQRPSAGTPRLHVGIAESVPKLIARRILQPARSMAEPLRIVCREDRTERLVSDLAEHKLDLLITDAPLPPGSKVRAFNHLLGESAISWFGQTELAAAARKGFPRSLEGAPVLLPTEGTMLRRALDAWFDDVGVRPRIVGEFDDSALLKEFGQEGEGLFPGPTAMESEVREQVRVELVAHTPEVKERFYAISAERRFRHPAAALICEAAREQLFASDAPR